MKRFILCVVMVLAGHAALTQTQPSLPKVYKIPTPDILKLDTLTANRNKRFWEQKIKETLSRKGSLRFSTLSHKTTTGSVYLLPDDRMPVLVPEQEGQRAIPNGWNGNKWVENKAEQYYGPQTTGQKLQ